MSDRRVFSSERLIAERETAGFTRAQVAVATCRSWGAIYQFESGRLAPGAEALVAMADLFGCSIDRFYVEETASV